MEKGEILAVLSRVFDPDYVDRSVVDMGLVTEDDITIKDDNIEIAYSLTAPMCPFSAAIGLMIKYALERELGVAVTITLKAEHYQGQVVAELLQDPQRSEELMHKLDEFGILKRCVRL